MVAAPRVGHINVFGYGVFGINGPVYNQDNRRRENDSRNDKKTRFVFNAHGFLPVVYYNNKEHVMRERVNGGIGE
jgi:hypothetical protein